jgi:tRNA (guanine-N7-)-methyltransferase
MSRPGRHDIPFRDKVEGESSRPGVNPYIDLHRTFGPPVIPAEDARVWKGRWNECFERDAPLHLEVGCGNGFFLAGMASRHPDRNWVGIEIRYKRVVLTARKLQAAGADRNARIVRYDAWWLDDLFEAGSVAGIYVNHPDPWMKDRHAEKRMMGPLFARFAAWALQPGGEVRLKSDHCPNLDGLVGGASGLPLQVIGRSDDVRVDLPWDRDDDVVTNYQSKFDRRDAPVHALRMRRTDGEVAPPSGPRQSRTVRADYSSS